MKIAISCLFCLVALFFLSLSTTTSSAFLLKNSTPSSVLPPPSSTSMSAAKVALDQAITKWCESSGYKANRIEWAGSSDWASFRKVLTDDQSFFVKTSTRSAKEMFQGEALGLQAMYECSSQQSSTSNSDQDGLLVIPKVHHWGDYTGGSLLIMDYLDLGGRGSDYSLGKAMARLHLASANEANGNPKGAFGFAIDNTIGGTPQPNPWTKGGTTEDWIEFYKKHRMEHQLQLAGDASCSKLWDDHIAPRMHLLFEGMTIKPSLLHGDLWSGNIGSANGKPSIFDPATYWGHHEAEWGMSWCASFSKDFWNGYRSLISKDQGFEDRKPLYDAYHQLNHYNLFGGSYIGSARNLLQQVRQILDGKEKS